MRDGLKYRKKGIFKEVWFSICSMHYHHDQTCDLCNSGRWVNVIRYKLSSLVYKISPKFWRWWVNRY